MNRNSSHEIDYPSTKNISPRLRSVETVTDQRKLGSVNFRTPDASGNVNCSLKFSLQRRLYSRHVSNRLSQHGAGGSNSIPDPEADPPGRKEREWGREGG